MSFHRNHLKNFIMTWCQNINDQIKQKSSKLCGKTWFAIDMRAPRCSNKWGSCNKSSKRASELYEIQQTIKYGAFAVCYAIVWCIVFAGLSRKPHTFSTAMIATAAAGIANETSHKHSLQLFSQLQTVEW